MCQTVYDVPYITPSGPLESEVSTSAWEYPTATVEEKGTAGGNLFSEERGKLKEEKEEKTLLLGEIFQATII